MSNASPRNDMGIDAGNVSPEVTDAMAATGLCSGSLNILDVADVECKPSVAVTRTFILLPPGIPDKSKLALLLVVAGIKGM